MSHIHWVARQNKLEISRDKDEVNKWEIHEYDGWSHDPDTMVAPLTPKTTRKTEALSRTPPTIVSCREETRHWGSGHGHGTVVRPVFWKLKQKSEVPPWKSRSHVSTQISMRLPPYPNHTPTQWWASARPRVWLRSCIHTATQEWRSVFRLWVSSSFSNSTKKKQFYYSLNVAQTP
jgi:hypothetical protein